MVRKIPDPFSSLLMSKILFLTMYPLKELNSAPKVRSFFLHNELNKIEKTDLIEGSRLSRSLKLIDWLVGGDFIKNRIIYVEASTTVGSPIELLVLTVAKFLRKRIFIYIRDAYPKFPDEFPADSIKTKILYLGWKISFLIYKFLSVKLIFPTKELASSLGIPEDKFLLLPPAGNASEGLRIGAKGHKIGYVGGFNPRYGSDVMIEMVSKLKSKFKDTLLVAVVRSSDLEKIESSSFEGKVEFKVVDYGKLKEVLIDVSICFLPLPETPYNKLSLPIKLFDYMSFGKAVVTTNLPAVAKIVREEKIGLVADNNPEDLAEKVSMLFDNERLIKEFQKNSLAAIRLHHSWSHRARKLYEFIEEYN